MSVDKCIKAFYMRDQIRASYSFRCSVNSKMSQSDYIVCTVISCEIDHTLYRNIEIVLILSSVEIQEEISLVIFKSYGSNNRLRSSDSDYRNLLA